MSDGLSFLIYGRSKVGKSWLADTAPAPRLVLDAEGGNGSRWTPSKKVRWDPISSAPPAADGSWETCIVNVRAYEIIKRVYEWLRSGEHPFRTVTIDSVSETQQRCIDGLVGTEIMQPKDWGTLLREMSKTIRDFRDLTEHPTRPLQAVVFIASTRESDGRQRPYVQGQLASVLPYQVDVLTYVQHIPDPNDPRVFNRFMMLQPDQAYESGDRCGGRLPPYIHVADTDQTLTNVLSTVFKQEDD